MPLALLRRLECSSLRQASAYLPNWKELDEKVEDALMKYRNHPSIIAIKQKVSYEKKFQTSHVYPWDVMNFVEELDASKSTNGNIPTKIIKMAKDVL